jgi:hypothetical protein
VISGGDGQDLISGAMGNDTIYGGAGDDTLGGVGNTGDNTEFGSDRIFGESGDDILGIYWNNSSPTLLDGGLGDDKLTDGGDGINTLTGGLGADTFEVANDGGYSVITDFTPNQDELRYWYPSGLEFRSLNGTPYQSFIGYEGIFQSGNLVAITQGIGTAQAAIDSALQA